jgi:hypothetical protein
MNLLTERLCNTSYRHEDGDLIEFVLQPRADFRHALRPDSWLLLG